VVPHAQSQNALVDSQSLSKEYEVLQKCMTAETIQYHAEIKTKWNMTAGYGEHLSTYPVSYR